MWVGNFMIRIEDFLSFHERSFSKRVASVVQANCTKDSRKCSSLQVWYVFYCTCNNAQANIDFEAQTKCDVLSKVWGWRWKVGWLRHTSRLWLQTQPIFMNGGSSQPDQSAACTGDYTILKIRFDDSFRKLDWLWWFYHDAILPSLSRGSGHSCGERMCSVSNSKVSPSSPGYKTD